MKERPILFNAEMVRAILSGQKPQTRRVVKPYEPRLGSIAVPSDVSYLPDFTCYRATCPYGDPGDQLWVRETWAKPTTLDPGPVVYRADSPDCVPRWYENVPPADAITWKPSIHMFRRDSRIQLEITGVRVERLQDISEEDAHHEGVDNKLCAESVGRSPLKMGMATQCGYAYLWDKINGPGSWDTNPWVWVIEFERMKP